MEISDNYNTFYICVDRKEREFISEDAPKKVEEYIKDSFQNKEKYEEFLSNWEAGFFGDYYSYIDYSDYGEDLEYDWLVELPKGTIESACGLKLSYKDGVKQIKIEPVYPIGIKFEII